MNARDNLKPNSIRLAILAGLANGAITTIDDLLISTGEPRKKLVALAEIETLNGEQLKATDRSKELLEQNDKLADELADIKDELEMRTQELNTVRVALSLASNARPVFNSGYVVQRPAKPLARFSNIENAKARAMCFARGGKRSQVFALVPVGVAYPGAEWRE